MSKKSKSGSIKSRPAWESTSAADLNEYDATKDPYCPYTRSDNFKSHMEKRPREVPDMSKSLPAIPMEFSTSMKCMERPYVDPKEKFPKHAVPNTSIGTSGLTFSAETSGSPEEGIAELEVLKAILNREGYLTRLEKTASTVSRKFKPEIADIVDLVRAASLDVIESVVKWRECKVCSNCYFIDD